ncbi:uncharacterized protein F5891DRAFT_1022892 [Suillus fuscotomentosus]|uniref:Uncharacterized protein n=1 Tax=Suillus fuscotomentosus TaxID=1912939 RepID=A0AAD4EAF5_9AGAM|nr:uncharacterized protein F5891DRAFT_1022892 [Suillus fuscotomentosus]KAG1902678.1 hypothetical protein F5891DRAFT_1022892 [Suillus fuscotomentosus]
MQFSSFKIGDEQDFRFDDIFADHRFPLLSRVRSNGYSQACLKSRQDGAVHDTSPTPASRHRLRRVKTRFSSKSPRQSSGSIPFQSPHQLPETILNLDQPETAFKHSNKDLSPITEDRETFANSGSLSTMFDSPMRPFTVFASRSVGKSSTENTTNVPVKTSHYSTSQEPSFSSGQRGIYSTPKLNSPNHSTSTAQWSPVSPLVFADMSSFPGQPPNIDVSHDLDLSDFPACECNTIITFGSCAHRSFNISAAVTEKGGKRLGLLDTLDAQLSNTDPARNVDSHPCTSGISTVNSIEASIIDTVPSRPGAPRASPLKRIWSRLRHAVIGTFSKRSDVAGVKDSRGREQGSRATRRMFASLLIAEASSARDQDAIRQSKRLTKPARRATASVVLDSKPSPQKRISKRSRPSNRTDINFATIFSPSFVHPA